VLCAVVVLDVDVVVGVAVAVEVVAVAVVVTAVVEVTVPAADVVAAGTIGAGGTGRFAMNPAASGVWMLDSAREMAPFPLAGRNETVVGAGINMPIPAASRSIRWSSAKVATLACSDSLRV
jgi:hypothetical protein